MVYIIFELQCLIELLFFVFQLYEIDDNPKRRDFLDELFSMMQNEVSSDLLDTFSSRAYKSILDSLNITT